ncbi:MAG: EF-hand domain-containing protein [Planctomycetes bacterium]|nr:EF-hand domain-containing protein [Planctomycetota bacterium]
MRKLVLAVVVLGLVFAIGWVATAQEGGGRARGGGGQRGARLDTDGDGVISADEWQGKSEVFKRIDKNDDGYLDSVELAEARDKWRRRKGTERRDEGAEEGTPERREALRKRAQAGALFAEGLFRLIDTDNDKKMSTEEIRAFARKLASADKDGDGYVTVEEARKALREAAAKKIGKAFFDRFDKNDDAKVTRKEFPGQDERFDRIDQDGDGVITPKDLKEAARKRAGQQAGQEARRHNRQGEEPRPGRRDRGSRDRGW